MSPKTALPGVGSVYSAQTLPTDVSLFSQLSGAMVALMSMNPAQPAAVQTLFDARDANGSPDLRRAFTLIELLVVIVIIAVLASIALPVISSVQNRSSSVKSVSNLRNIGTAIQCYINDNNNTLPGPLYTAQSGTWVKGNTVSYTAQPVASANGALLCFLGPYLGNPATGKIAYTDSFMYPAFVPYAKKNPTAPAYYMANDISSNGVGTAGATNGINPWGNKNSATSLPMRMSEVSLYCYNLSGAWAVAELDQQFSGVTGASSWYSELPPKPVHNGGRNALCFDWHVGRLDNQNNVQ